MKKSILRIILVLTLLLSTSITAFANRQPTGTTSPTDRQTRGFDAYAAPVFTLRNVIIYNNIEIQSVQSDARIVLYSGPEVNEATVITSSSKGYINWDVPVSGRYTLTWTDTWGGGWYWY